LKLINNREGILDSEVITEKDDNNGNISGVQKHHCRVFQVSPTIYIYKGDKMKYFVTADLHLGHDNIIKYCNRPFKSIDHMNDTLIKNWNERVKDEDSIYIVGDFCFKSSRSTTQKWIKLLNGNKIFIKGNHDDNISNIVSLQIQFDGITINMTHIPVVFNTRCGLNLVGHVHDRWKYHISRTREPYSMYTCEKINVGVDVWDFYPVTLKEVMQFYHTCGK